MPYLPRVWGLRRPPDPCSRGLHTRGLLREHASVGSGRTDDQATSLPFPVLTSFPFLGFRNPSDRFVSHGGLMSCQTFNAIEGSSELTITDIGTYQTGDVNNSSENRAYSGAVFNISENHRPANTTFYIMAGSTITITDLFDPSGTLPDGFISVGGYNEAVGVWGEISRTLENGDEPFTFRWNSITGSGPIITIIVVDIPDPVPELGFLSDPMEDGVIEFVS